MRHARNVRNAEISTTYFSLETKFRHNFKTNIDFTTTRGLSKFVFWHFLCVFLRQVCSLHIRCVCVCVFSFHFTYRRSFFAWFSYNKYYDHHFLLVVFISNAITFLCSVYFLRVWKNHRTNWKWNVVKMLCGFFSCQFHFGEKTYIVPFATVIFKLIRTWFGFDLFPYCLNACRTDTAFCCRFHTVPPSSMIDMFDSLPLEMNKKNEKTKAINHNVHSICWKFEKLNHKWMNKTRRNSQKADMFGFREWHSENCISKCCLSVCRLVCLPFHSCECKQSLC